MVQECVSYNGSIVFLSVKGGKYKNLQIEIEIKSIIRYWRTWLTRITSMEMSLFSTNCSLGIKQKEWVRRWLTKTRITYETCRTGNIKLKYMAPHRTHPYSYWKYIYYHIRNISQNIIPILLKFKNTHNISTITKMPMQPNWYTEPNFNSTVGLIQLS